MDPTSRLREAIERTKLVIEITVRQPVREVPEGGGWSPLEAGWSPGFADGVHLERRPSLDGVIFGDGDRVLGHGGHGVRFGDDCPQSTKVGTVLMVDGTVNNIVV